MRPEFFAFGSGAEETDQVCDLRKKPWMPGLKPGMAGGNMQRTVKTVAAATALLCRTVAQLIRNFAEITARFASNTATPRKSFLVRLVLGISNRADAPSLDFFFRGTSDIGHPQPIRGRLCARNCDTRAGTKASSGDSSIEGPRSGKDYRLFTAMRAHVGCERMSKESENQA